MSALKKTLDGKLLKKLLLGGGRWLTLHRRLLNEINIFPVPDRDTGSNMSFTVRGTVKILCGTVPTSVASTAQRAALGALMEAHGNSGVIFSQILHGFAKGLEGLSVATPSDLALALHSAAEAAYNSLQEPIEGTILSLISFFSQQAKQLCQENPDVDLISFLVQLTEKGRYFLSSNQLNRECPEVLRTAQIADAGAVGLYYFFEGMSRVAQGLPLCLGNPREDSSSFISRLNSAIVPELDSVTITPSFRYCSEFTLTNCNRLDKAVLEQGLIELGSSVIVSAVQNFLKVHLHTDFPDLAEKFLSNYGQIIGTKIDNLAEQCLNRNKIIAPEDALTAPTPCEENFSMLGRPSHSKLDKLQLPTIFICPWGNGFDEYFQEGWGFILLPLNEAEHSYLKYLNNRRISDKDQAYIKPILFTKNKFISRENSPLSLTEQHINWLNNSRKYLHLYTLQNQIQLLALLTSENFHGCFDNLSDLNWGEIDSTFSKNREFENNSIRIVKKNGDYLGQANGLSGAVELYISSLPYPPRKRMLLTSGLNCSADTTEEAIEKLMKNYPKLTIQLLYGGQPDSEMLVYAE
ncbi:MAG: DAK2 domain-containing protein [Candidatus Bruticola sp.]